MKLSTFLALAIASMRLLGCASDPSGTTVAGSVQLSRTTGAETGQTGFVFPDRTLLEENPFYGSCSIEKTADGTVLSLLIERAQPDAFGLSSFALETPIETPIQPGRASVSATAGGTTFSDASGSCSLVWGDFHEEVGRIGVTLDCNALTGGSGSETVGLAVDLSLDGCK